MSKFLLSNLPSGSRLACPLLKKNITSNYYRICLILFIIIITGSAQAQQTTDLEHKAPTLQIGLDGLSLSKGALDYEVIAQMIAEKQSEIKLKFIQNLFLTRMEKAGGQSYSYVENILNSIITEKNPELRARQVLEQTVNMVFVAAYAHYYIDKIDKENKSKDDSLSKIERLQLLSHHIDSMDRYVTNSTNAKVNRKYLNLTDKLDDKRDERGKAILGVKTTNFKALILDMASEAIRKDKNLKRLGLMQISRSATYEYKNIYLQILKDSTTQDNSSVKVYKEDIKKFYSAIQDDLSVFTKNIGLINSILQENTFRNSDLNVLKKAADFYSESNKIDKNTLESYLKFADTLLVKGVKQIASENFTPDSVRKTQIENIQKVINYLKKTNTFLKKSVSDTANSAVFSDIIYSISKEFIPSLEAITYNYPEMLDVTSKLKSFSEGLSYNLVKDLNLEYLTSKQVQPFILLTSKLYEFDKAKTFSDYLSYANDLIDLFPDERIKTVFSNVNTFVKDYTVLKVNEKGKEVIEFNVEDFLVKLQNIRKERYNPFKFHFTVGLNSGYFKTPLYYKSDTLTSFSTVSEKIGVKIKLRDFKFTKLRNPGETYNYFWRDYVRESAPKDPLISDVHILLYGSGILYSVLNTSTNKTFDSPIAGVGIGLTFSNALDLNLSMAIPVLNDRSFKQSMKNPLFTLGFDVQIGEYLSRIGKKNKSK